jgi:hypothetical protein
VRSWYVLESLDNSIVAIRLRQPANLTASLIIKSFMRGKCGKGRRGKAGGREQENDLKVCRRGYEGRGVARVRAVLQVIEEHIRCDFITLRQGLWDDGLERPFESLSSSGEEARSRKKIGTDLSILGLVGAKGAINKLSA